MKSIFQYSILRGLLKSSLIVASILFTQNATSAPSACDSTVMTSWMPSGARTHANNADHSSVFSFDYATRGNVEDTPLPVELASASEVGTVWGKAYDANAKKLYTSAFLRRHADLSPDGLGAIYAIGVSDTSSDATVGTPSLWMNLNSTTHLGSGATLFPTATAASRGLSSPFSPSHDVWAYNRVGKQGIGGLELSDDFSTMYAMDMTNRQLLVIDVVSKTVTSRHSVNDPGCKGGSSDVRPFGVDYLDGNVYIGVSCSGETRERNNDVDGYVMKLSGSSFTKVVSGAEGHKWSSFWSDHPYVDSNRSCGQNPRMNNFVPVITNMELDENNNMIIGVTSINGFRFASKNYVADTSCTTLTSGHETYGYILNATPSGSTWNLASSELHKVGTPRHHYKNGQFAHWGSGSYRTFIGGMSVTDCAGQEVVMYNAMDPLDYESGGTRYMRTSDAHYETATSNGDISLSSATASTIEHYKGNGNTAWEKSAGLGDIEFLQAPTVIVSSTGSIIGTVYLDVNGDNSYNTGLESGIPLITVSLYDDNGTASTADDTQLTTTSSAADGSYTFSNVDSNLSYRIEVDTADTDLPSDGSIGTSNPLFGVAVTADTTTTEQNFGFDTGGNICPNCNIIPPICYAATSLLWENKSPNEFIHWGVEHKMIDGDSHVVFNAADLPSELTNPPAAGTTVNLNFGTWEERTPNVNDGYQPGEQINVIFLDASDNIIWRSNFTDDVLDTAPTNIVSSVIDQSTTISTGVAKILVAHKSHATYNTDLGWIGSIYPNHVCLEVQANTGNISGNVYTDINGNNSYNTGLESGISSITVTLYDDKGTTSTADDTLISTTSSAVNGSYTFSALSTSLTYRIEVDIGDTDLPTGSSIGTINPLTNIIVTSNSTTTDQNFGFDVSTSCNQALDFQNPVLESGSNKQTGAIYRFSNIDTGIDALVEILNVSNADIGALDDTSSGSNAAFQPELMMDQSSGASISDQHVDFEIRFVTAGTNTPTTLATVYATAVDIDGDTDETREYTILESADSYTFENPTNLTSPSLGKFTPANTDNVNGISLTNTEAMVTALYNNVSSIRYTTGFSNTGADYVSYHRQSSLSFDCVTYNSPQTTGNISGTIYTDANGNNSYNTGLESGIPSIFVSLFDDKSTTSTADDTQIATTSSAADGSYSFTALSTSLTYRIEVDTADTDLTSGSTIGTTNPLTGITVAANNTTSDQDFGFDLPTNSLASSFNCTNKTQTSWANSNPKKKDWIGIYNATEQDTTKYLDWYYLNGSKTAPTSTSTSGTITFSQEFPVGSYKTILFENDGYTVLKSSNTFAITDCAEAFTCSSNLYQSSNLDLNITTEMGLYKINRTDNPYTMDRIGAVHDQTYNALAYRLQDDFIYATYQSTLLRIGSNGIIDGLGNINGLPANTQHSAGTMDSDGFYYVGGLDSAKSDKIYKVDVTVTPPRVIDTITLSRPIYTWDFVYINNSLYGIEATSLAQTGKLMKIAMDGTISTIGQPLSSYSFGSAFTDSTGSFFAIDDNDGGFFKIDINTGDPIKLSEGIPSRLNDGANCATATIPAEQPDLSLKKRLANGQNHTVNPNSIITFTLDITNEGTTSVRNIELIDYIPGVLTLNDSNWTSNASGSNATLNTPIPTLAAGDTVSIDISFTANTNVITRNSQTRIGGVLIPEEEGCKNAAEIKAFLGGTDSDSTPDSIPDNDRSEDDYDVANINVSGVCSGVFDYGDAPDTAESSGKNNYQTQFNDNGAKHSVSELLYLGNCVDTDDGDLQNTLADADDNNLTTNKTIGNCSIAGDDEDGLIPPELADSQASPSINVKVFNNTGGDAVLYCWVDYNGDGVFSNTNERGQVSVSHSSSTQNVSLTLPNVPSTAGYDTDGNTYLRCRIASGEGASNSTGSAANGEVEDYPVVITTHCTVSANTTNIQCDDKGTSNPTDDTWSFDTLVNAIGVSATNWAMSGDHSANGNYGQNTAVPVGLISAKPELNVVITDALDNTCKAVQQITAPNNCSSNCGLFLDQGNISIDDKGTDLAADDELTVEIVISGVTPANAAWEVSRKVGSNTYISIATGSGSQTTIVTVKVSDIISNDPNGFTLRVKQDNSDCSVETYINLSNINTLEINKTVVGDTAPANWEFTLTSSNCTLPVGLTNPTSVSGDGGNTSFVNLEIYDNTGQSCLYELSENTQDGYALDSAASDNLTNIVLTEGSTKIVNIVNDQQAFIFVDDVSVVEGDSGTVDLNFVILLNDSSTRSTSTIRGKDKKCKKKDVHEKFKNNTALQTWTQINLTNTACTWSIDNKKLKELTDILYTGCKGFINYPVDATKYHVDSDSYELKITIDSNYQNSISNYPKDNNGVGIVFGYQDENNYYLARWLDYGNIYDGLSSYHYRYLQLIKQDNGSEILLGEKYIDLPEKFKMEVKVDEAGIKLKIDKDVELEVSSRPILNAFGLYTIDNDDGVFYSDLHAHTQCPSDGSGTVESNDVEVNFTITEDTATEGVDFEAVSSGTVTIIDGQSSVQVTVPVKGDTLVEPDETFTIELFEEVNGTIVRGTATGTIIDDDVSLIPAISIANSSIIEGDSATKNLDFTVTLSSPAPSGGSSITYTSSNGTATIADNDYEAVTGTLTIIEGDSTGTISVVINGDTNVEADETFTLSLSSPSNATVTNNQATGTIINDDYPITPIVEYRFEECAWDGTSNEVVDSSGNSLHGTAAGDATTISTGIVGRAGLFDGSGDYAKIANNALLNPTGAFTVSTWANAAALGNWNGIASKLRSNTRQGWNLQFGSAQRIASLQGAGSWTYLKSTTTPQVDTWYHVVMVHNSDDTNLLYINGTLEKTNSRDISFTDNPFYIGKFYTNSSGITFNGRIDELKIFDSALSSTEITDIYTNEGNGLNYDGSNRVPTSCGAPPNISISDNAIVEGNSGTKTLSLAVVLDAPAPTGGTNINYSTSDGTATDSNNDYEPNTSGTLTILAGSSFGTVDITINGDTDIEADETFIVTLSSPINGVIIDSQATGTIINDDVDVVSNCAQIIAADQSTLFPQNQADCITIPRTTPIPQISIADNSITEGNSGTSNLSFTVTLDSLAPAGGTQISYNTTDATATTVNNDYVAASSGTLTIAEGFNTGIISIVINGDTDVENDETFQLNLSSPTGGTITDAQAIGTILNDDSALTPVAEYRFDQCSWDGSANEVLDNTSYANHGTALSGANTSNDAILGYSGDFSGANKVEAANQTQIEIGKNNADFAVTFWLKLQQGNTGSWRSITQKGNGGQRTFAMWMRPSDNRVHHRISTTSSWNAGGDSVAAMPIDTWTHIAYVKVDNKLHFYVNGVINRTSTLPSDVISNASPLRIGGNYSGTGTNSRIDEYKIFDTTLSDADVLSIYTNENSGLNYDGSSRNAMSCGSAPTISIADNAVTEGNSGTKNLDFTVTLDSPAPASGVQVAYSTTNVTATTANSDYNTASGTLSIPSGSSTGTISVVINGDTNIELDETFQLNLSSPVGGVIADAQAIGTIINDDAAQCSSASGDFGGTVFRDYNDNGTQDLLESGIARITVTAYDTSNNSVATATTGLTGVYVLSGVSIGNQYRLEFTNLPDHIESGSSNSTVRFITVAASCTNNLAIQNPAQYCQAAPDIAANFYISGEQSTAKSVLFKVPHTAGNDGSSNTGSDYDAPAFTSMATSAQIGTTFGLAWQSSSRTLFASSFLKRFAAYGSGGSSAIYKIDESQNASVFLDLDDYFGANSTGVDPHPAGTNWERDNTASIYVGKRSLGGLALSDDEKTLYTINLASNELYEIPIGIPASAPANGGIRVVSTPQPANCVAGDTRPFATVFHDGLLYVGITCTAESTADRADLKAYVYSYTPQGAFSAAPVMEAALNYPRECIDVADWTTPGSTYYCEESAPGEWNTWISGTWPTVLPPKQQLNVPAYPQPWLTDIAFDNGEMILAIRDRFGDQTGNRKTPNPALSTSTINGVPGGDLLRACKAGSQWVLESNGSCGGITTTPDYANPDGAGPGSPGREYYWDDYMPVPYASAINEPFQTENTLGGLALISGKTDLVVSVFDPIKLNGPADDVWGYTADSGLVWYDNQTGGRTHSYRAENGGNASADPDRFDKSNPLGDIEPLCDAASIEVGDYVWNDANNDGIQGADESGLSALNVQLVCGADNATTTTNANGQYYFSNDQSSGNATFMTTGKSCSIRIDTTQASLVGASITTTNVEGGSTNNAKTDIRDSDAVTNGSNAEIIFTVGDAGQNNHSLDIGFANFPITSLTPSFDCTNKTQIAWANNNPSTTDWIGLYNASQNNTASYLDWRYLNNSKTAPSSTSTSGTVSFTQDLPAGDYKVILFSNNSFSVLSESNTFTLSGCGIPTPLADYRFDACSWDGTAGEVIDSSGNAHHSVSLNMDTTDTAKIARSGDFTANGTQDYLSLDYTALNGVEDFSISTWIKTSNTSNQAVLSGATGSSTNETLLWIRNTTFYPYIKGSNGSISIPNIADNQWHHLVWRRSGAENCMYVDGTKAGTCSSRTQGALNIAQNGLVIGQEQDAVGGGFSGSQDFEGYIDELKIFGIALSDADISTIYNNENSGLNYDGTNRSAISCSSPPNISIADNSITEGNSGTSNLDFTVTLDIAAPTGGVQVTYTTADATATTSNNDYNANSGTLTIAAGSSTGTISVVINGDTDVESDESFQLNLSNPIGGVLINSQAIGTIENDDVDSCVGATNTSSGTIRLSGTVRDFYDYNKDNSKHPDFQNYSYKAPDGAYSTTGLVQSTLDAERKPVLLSSNGNNNGTIYQAITDTQSFSQWFRDTAGFNLSKTHEITLTKTGNVYVYDSDAFFPIDNQLLGNEGDGSNNQSGYYGNSNHNYHFTYDIHSQFTYQGGETFEFRGDDDVWIFINNELVVDIGGIHSSVTGSVNLDSLGLTLGQNYNFDFFFAERAITGSNLRITTSIEFADDCLGRIIGNVYSDENGNSNYDSSSEVGISNITVDLFDSSGTSVASTSSSANGSYSFSSLNPSESYRVTVDITDTDLPSGATLSTTNPLNNITVTAGNSTTDKDFGFQLPNVDLKSTKTSNKSVVQSGDQVTFTLSIENVGTSTASNVNAVDALPTGMTYLSHSGDGTYNSSSGAWSISSINAGAATTLQIIVTIN